MKGPPDCEKARAYKGKPEERGSCEPQKENDRKDNGGGGTERDVLGKRGGSEEVILLKAGRVYRLQGGEFRQKSEGVQPLHKEPVVLNKRQNRLILSSFAADCIHLAFSQLTAERAALCLSALASTHSQPGKERSV